jgi:hypothetical protein
MKVEVLWRIFKIGDILKRDTTLALKENIKNIELSDTKDEMHKVALVSSSRSGSGIVGYLMNNTFDTKKISKKKLTFDDQWGFTYFQEDDFLITGGHNCILEFINEDIYNSLKNNDNFFLFIASIINKITIKNGIYGYTYKINYKLDNEIILLPLSLSHDENNFHFKIENKSYIINTDAIDKIVNQAKNNKLIKRKIEIKKEINRLISISKIYEDNYKKEKLLTSWHSFEIGYIFEQSTEHYLEKSKKNYNLVEKKSEEFFVAVCAASKINKGIVGYINEVDDVALKRRKNFLTKGGFGHVFFQDDWFVKPGGSWGMLNILKIKNNNFRNDIESFIFVYEFLAKILTEIFTNFSSWGYQMNIDREIILLPLIFDKNGYFKKNDKNYVISKNYLSFLFLKSKILNLQKMQEGLNYDL